MNSMKKYLLASILTLALSITGNSLMAQCTPDCGKPTDCKPDPACPCVCTEACPEAENLAGTPWEGNVTINGKSYKATGKIYSSEKGSFARLNIAELKLENEVFAVSKDRKNRYSFTPLKSPQ